MLRVLSVSSPHVRSDCFISNASLDWRSENTCTEDQAVEQIRPMFLVDGARPLFIYVLMPKVLARRRAEETLTNLVEVIRKSVPVKRGQKKLLIHALGWELAVMAMLYGFGTM